MNDWQEAYYDLVNKVECECVQQGDLVPIWEQFKRMSLTIQKLQGHQGALEAEIEQMREAGKDLGFYAGHDDSCDCVKGWAKGPCNCGYTETWKQWSAALGETK